MLDKFMHSRFEPNNVHCLDVNKPSDDEIPYDFEHVYNITSRGYEYCKDNCCYYSPVININNYKVKVFNDNVLKVTRDKVYAKGVGLSKIKFKKRNGDVVVLDVKVFHPSKMPRALTKDKPNKNDFKVYLFKGGVFSVKDVLRHGMCRHFHNCMFKDKKLWVMYDELTGSLKVRINEVRSVMGEYNYLLECYGNGEILFHKDFEDYYSVSFVGGKVSVCVDDGFVGAVSRGVRMLEVELRDLNRELFRLER